MHFWTQHGPNSGFTEDFRLLLQPEQNALTVWLARHLIIGVCICVWWAM